MLQSLPSKLIRVGFFLGKALPEQPQLNDALVTVLLISCEQREYQSLSGRFSGDFWVFLISYN